MAQDASLYLPDVSKLFSGEDFIRSWFDIPTNIWQSSQIDLEVLEKWQNAFQHERVRTQLQQTQPWWQKPNDTSQKLCDQATAAINISPSSNNHYDIQQIRDDSRWITKQLSIDQIQALRIVLLEWQKRPQLHLQAGYSEAELASLKDVYAAATAFDGSLDSSTFLARDEQDFNTVTARHRRQIHVYFQECIGFSRVWLAVRDARLSSKLELPPQESRVLDEELNSCMQLATNMIESLQHGPDWDVIDANSDYLWHVGTIFNVKYLMQALVATARLVTNISGQVIVKWFTTMGDCLYLSEVQSSPLLPPKALHDFYAMITLTSMTLIDAANTIAQLEVDPSQHWMSNQESVLDVQENLFNAVDASCQQAMPVALAWVLILQKVRDDAIEVKDRRDGPAVQRAIDTYDSATGRRASIPTPNIPSTYEEIIETVSSRARVSDPITAMLRHLVENNAVSEQIADIVLTKDHDILPAVLTAKMQTVQELVRIATDLLPESERYGSTILIPQFALLDSGSQSKQEVEDLTNASTWFLGLDGLVENTLDVAAARFPYEALPFLRLCRLLARSEVYQNGCQYTTFRLQNLESFTHVALGTLSQYHTIDEEENANRVELDHTAWAFPPTQHQLLLTSGHQQQNIIIPANTVGDVISTHEPAIVRWKLNYSGFHIIGEWLDRHFHGSLVEILPEHESDVEVATEMILLLANLIMSTSSAKNTGCNRHAAVLQILADSSEHLTVAGDIATLIFDILEQELQSYHRRPSNTFDTSILFAALSFAKAIATVLPVRFWQLIGRTSLIDSRGGHGQLFILISGTEAFTGDFSITEASAALYDEMVSAALQAPCEAKPERQWRGKQPSSILNTMTRSFTHTVCGMTENMLSIVESFPRWKSYSQSTKVIANICRTFERILFYTHSIGSPTSVLSSYFQQAAALIMEKLMIIHPNDAKTSPIMSLLFDSIVLLPSFTTEAPSQSLFESLTSLASVLIANNDFWKDRASGFEICLFNLVPIYIRHFPSSLGKTASLVRLLLYHLSVHRPVSLLGHLGTESAIDLINILVDIQGSRFGEARNSWLVLTALIAKDQQWLSVVLLTGQTPEKVKPRGDENIELSYRGKLIMDQAIRVLGDIENKVLKQQDSATVAEVLRFVIVAQQNWAWTLQALRNKKDVFASMMQFVRLTKMDDKSRSGLWRRRLVPLITDLCSVHLHHAKAVRDTALVKSFKPLIDWLTLNSIECSNYNGSLHTNIGRNFKSKFGSDLSDFKAQHRDGERGTTFYNLVALDFVLQRNSAWTRDTHSKDPNGSSYRDEVERANVNLDVVQTDLEILHSFHDLIIEHAAFFKEESGLRPLMAHITARCLKANATRQPEEQLYDSILVLRAEMILLLSHCLVEKNVHGSEYAELLPLAWASTLTCAPNYDSALAADNIAYWRMCLSAVLLSLQFHLRSDQKNKSLALANSGTGPLHRPSAIMPQIVEITTVVVGEGLNTVVSLLQEQQQAASKSTSSATISVGMKDIALITRVLDTILRLPDVGEFSSQISERLISTDAIDSAVKLYSWAHLLADETSKHDPVYAELALRLLVSISSLPAVAEEMAIHGILNSLLTARVTQVLQNIPGGATSLDNRQHCRSLYAIWSEGLLPLALNLLHAVQGPVAAESSLFLNQFPQQLRLASQAFKPREGSFITISMAKEASCLSLISFVLDGYRTAGPSAAVDPSSVTVLEGFDEHKAALRSDIIAHLALDRRDFVTKIVPLTDAEAAGLNGPSAWTSDKITKELEMASSSLATGDTEEQGD